MNEISYHEALNLKNPIFIDVRSENEFAEDHISQAINHPILNNIERAHVGTVYKQESIEKAKLIGIEYASKKLPNYFKQIQDYINADHQVVLYCRGGGFRSQSLFLLLRSLGEPVYKLRGGYKEFRKEVIAQLNNRSQNIEFVTLNGYTGVGKTEILAGLEKLGAQVLDLEKIANHRGSNFGAIGLGEQPTQKEFERKLLEEINPFEDGIVFVESESNKIGQLYVPNALRLAYKDSAHQVMITSPLDIRVERIYQEYIHLEDQYFQTEVIKALQGLNKYIGDKHTQEIRQLLQAKNYQKVIEILITKYYDTHYNIRQNQFELTLDHIDTKATCQKLLDYYHVFN